MAMVEVLPLVVVMMCSASCRTRLVAAELLGDGVGDVAGGGEDRDLVEALERAAPTVFWPLGEVDDQVVVAL